VSKPNVKLLISAMHLRYLRGGGEYYPFHVARRLRDKGCDVTFLVGKDPFMPGASLAAGFRERSLPFLYVIRIAGEKTPGIFGKVLRTLHRVLYMVGVTLYLLFRGRRYDCVMTHDFVTLQAAVLVRRFLKPKIIATLHGKPTMYECGLLQKVDGVISVSTAFVKDLETSGVKNVWVIPVGVDQGLFCPVSSQEKAGFRTMLDLPADVPIILFVGRLVPIKNIELLLNAIPDVINQLPEAHLVLVGEGTAEKKLKERAVSLGVEHAVHFAGNVDQKSLARYYQSADAFVLPSHSEAFGMAGVEALSCGLPVLMTENSPAFHAAFPKEVTAISTTDSGMLAQHVTKALLEKSDVQAQKKRHQLASAFNWKVQVDKTMQLIHEVCT
jgi:glycosyltransferase involved in cell wall biosynthesis